MELASDHKDFASALAKTQLAEMGSVKMVSIPQPPRHKKQSVVSVRSASVATG